ncbi:MAG: aryl-sulfate sulfotransferase N-terminal domain-containing protein, partial [Spirochaetota bacterium]
MLRRIMFVSFSLLVVTVVIVIAALALRPVGIDIEPAKKVPLAAVVTVTSREPTRVSVTLHGRHHDDVVAAGDTTFATSHSIDLLGLYPDSLNELTVRAETAAGNVYERRRVVETAALPDSFPTVEIVRHAPDRIAPGMTFMILGHY